MNTNFYPATLGKRLLAITYDALIIIFITVVLTIIIQQLVISLDLIKLEKIKDISGEISVIPATSFLAFFLKSLWTIISFLYFAYF